MPRAGHCVQCGRFVGKVYATIQDGMYGAGLKDVLGTCAVHGQVEAIEPEFGWSWEDFYGEEDF